MKLLRFGSRNLYFLVVVFAVFALGVFFWKRVGRTQTFQLFKLCELADTNHVSIIAPDGRNLSIVFAVPKATAFNHKLAHGTIEIYSGESLVKSFKFVLTNATPAGWLDASGMTSWILTWPMNAEAVQLDSVFSAGGRYSIRAKTDNEKTGSFWLAYTQPWEKRDRKGYVLLKPE